MGTRCGDTVGDTVGDTMGDTMWGESGGHSAGMWGAAGTGLAEGPGCCSTAAAFFEPVRSV